MKINIPTVVVIAVLLIYSFALSLIVSYTLNLGSKIFFVLISVVVPTNWVNFLIPNSSDFNERSSPFCTSDIIFVFPGSVLVREYKESIASFPRVLMIFPWALIYCLLEKMISSVSSFASTEKSDLKDTVSPSYG